MKKNLSIMIKPSSGLCNLKCEYCFYHSLAKTREQVNYGFMSKNTAENLILKAIDFSNGGEIFFTFQGGEPLLSKIDFYKHFVNFANSNKKECKINYSLQTNGLLLDEEYVKFFKENKFLLGISLDGDFEANKYRIDEKGENSFDKICQNIELLNKFEVDYNILTVVTKKTAKRIRQIYIYFKRKKFKYLQFIPYLKPLNDIKLNKFSMNSKEYEVYLNELFQLYYDDYKNGNYTSIRHFDNFIKLIKYNVAEQCGVSGLCSRQLVVEGNGNIYPCDFYCIDEYLLGNINEILNLNVVTESTLALNFLKESLIVPEKCKKCKFNYICRACGCKKYRQDIDNFCKAYYGFIEKNLEKLNNF